MCCQLPLHLKVVPLQQVLFPDVFVSFTFQVLPLECISVGNYAKYPQFESLLNREGPLTCKPSQAETMTEVLMKFLSWQRWLICLELENNSSS